jgi:protein phosphatase
VGDSRAYLCSTAGLERITRDQTWVAEIGARLGLADSALKTHPMRHVLTMAIGRSDDLRVQSETVDLTPGQQILLCSDGLHGVIGEDFLQQTLLSPKSLAEKAHYLVDAAKNEGGPDNITVVLIQVH